MSGFVFISYSAKDEKSAQTISVELEARGIHCWLAKRDVRPGENFQEAIFEAIAAASTMVLVFSENANGSDEIKKELAIAGQRGLTVIPVRVEDAKPRGAFAYELATRQWVDVFGDWHSGLDLLASRLASTVAAEARSIRPRDGEPPPAQTRGGAPMIHRQGSALQKIDDAVKSLSLTQRWLLANFLAALAEGPINAMTSLTEAATGHRGLANSQPSGTLITIVVLNGMVSLGLWGLLLGWALRTRIPRLPMGTWVSLYSICGVFSGLVSAFWESKALNMDKLSDTASQWLADFVSDLSGKLMPGASYAVSVAIMCLLGLCLFGSLGVTQALILRRTARGLWAWLIWSAVAVGVGLVAVEAIQPAKLGDTFNSFVFEFCYALLMLPAVHRLKERAA